MSDEHCPVGGCLRKVAPFGRALCRQHTRRLGVAAPLAHILRDSGAYPCLNKRAHGDPTGCRYHLQLPVQIRRKVYRQSLGWRFVVCHAPILARQHGKCYNTGRSKHRNTERQGTVMPRGGTATFCSVEGCDRKVTSHGKCSKHWKRELSAYLTMMRKEDPTFAMRYTIDSTKACGHCKQEKPLDAFRVAPERVSGYSSWCNECTSTARKQWRQMYPDDGKALYARHRVAYRAMKLRSLYGMTMEDYWNLFHAQNGVCAVCGMTEKRKMRGELTPLVVDHDHVTGKVRGLLCYACNYKLGVLENAEWFGRAWAYLERAKGNGEQTGS